MLNSELQLNLNEQKILPILNTTTLSNDIDRLSKYLEKNRAIRYIEITLRENQSFDTKYTFPVLESLLFFISFLILSIILFDS